MTALEHGQLPRFMLYRLFQISFGGILALPHLYAQLQKAGRLRFYWLPFAVLGLPALLVSLGLLHDVLQLGPLQAPILGAWFYSGLSYGFTRSFASILVGYLSIQCWIKPEAPH